MSELMNAPPGMVEITCYIPTKTRSGTPIDPKKIQNLIDKVWPKYRGATKSTGTGYYRPDSGDDEVAECYILSIVTELTRAIKNNHGELKALKEKIKLELDQEKVLIKWQRVNVV